MCQRNLGETPKTQLCVVLDNFSMKLNPRRYRKHKSPLTLHSIEVLDIKLKEDNFLYANCADCMVVAIDYKEGD